MLERPASASASTSDLEAALDAAQRHLGGDLRGLADLLVADSLSANASRGSFSAIAHAA